MKALLIIFAPAIECEVMGCLEKAQVKKYTRLPYLQGVGGHSEPRLDTQVWPGSNSALLVVSENASCDKLANLLKPLKQQELEEGLKVFAFPVEEII
ncbi:MAG: PG0541 family transporter-associated protein [Candidatus Margulisiibacteriota bacterium]